MRRPRQGREAEDKKGGSEGGAGNPDQSAARKTRHNTRGQRKTEREQGEKGREREQKTGRTEKGKGNEGAKANDTEGQMHPTHKQTREREKERSLNGGGKVVTASVKSRRQRGLSKTKRGAGTMRQ